MKTSSAKAKGRKLQDEVAKRLLKEFEPNDFFIGLKDGDVKPAIMGEQGCDIKLSPWAKSVLPFDIECKNTEKLNVWQAITQAEANSTEERRIPLVVFKRNRSKIYCVIEFDKLLGLL